VRGELSRFGPQAGMAELVEAWPAAVGEQIARFAWPARIARDGTVHVHTADSVWAFELGHRAAEIAGRLGVTSLRFAP
jgi:predicted nucleic acid-binding Zn ribbon protein